MAPLEAGKILLILFFICLAYDTVHTADSTINTTMESSVNNSIGSFLTTQASTVPVAEDTTTSAVESSVDSTTDNAKATANSAGVENGNAVTEEKIWGMPIPVFATVVSFFGTPLVFIILCGAVAACKSLSCRRVADQRSGKVAPSLASDSFDVNNGGQHEMREFPAHGGKTLWHKQEEAEPPPFKAPSGRRALQPDEDDEPRRQPPPPPPPPPLQQQQQKLRNPYLEQLGQIIK